MSMEISALARIPAAVQQQREYFTSLLENLVRLESPTSEPETIGPVLDMLEGELRPLDYEVTRLPGRHSGGLLYARPKQRQRAMATQLMLGHCDTVWPTGTIREMPCYKEGGRIHGPGIYDMKSGLVMMITALRVLKEKGLTPSVLPVILINSDEELHSEDSRPYIERLAKTVDRVWVLEPSLGSEGRIKTARKGVGQYELVLNGRPSHAGLDPEQGASAILGLSHVIQQLFEMNDPELGISVNVGTIDGGIRSNVVAPRSRASVDVRVLNREDAQQIDHAIRQLDTRNPDVSIEVQGGMERPPLAHTPANRKLWERVRQQAKILGMTLQEVTAGGASDGNLTSPFAATIDGLGAVGDGAHATYEHIDLEPTLERCALLASLLLLPAENPRSQS